MSFDRLTMPIGEAMFTQRSIRKLRPDAIPVEDLRLILEAAVKAPNGGNHQVGRFLVVTEREKIREFGTLYQEAWWAKRWDDHRWTKPEDIPAEEKSYHSAMGLADFCIPLGYPAVKYGPSRRKPISETTSWNRWANPVPWA